MRVIYVRKSLKVFKAEDEGTEVLEINKNTKWGQVLIFDGAVFELLVLTEERPIEPWLNL